MSVIELNENDLNEKINNGGKVIVDCYAPWCGTCRMLSPIIDEIADEMKDLSFYKLNVDEQENFARKYGISSIPTILIFEDGRLINQIIGFRPKEELKQIIAS